MKILEQKQGAVTVVKPVGPLIKSETAQFKAKLLEVRQGSMGRFVVDTSALPFLDSSGLEALVEVNEELAQSGQSLKLCNVNETLREVFDLTEVGPLFDQFEDVGAAVRSFI